MCSTKSNLCISKQMITRKKYSNKIEYETKMYSTLLKIYNKSVQIVYIRSSTNTIQTNKPI